ncbi:MAG: helix-turn-helix transcriptional regulator [Proteobacteria bacterium]|nr:helix-turn-helix transcriptional regulator [Pseudomonadota bacterium]
MEAQTFDGIAAGFFRAATGLGQWNHDHEAIKPQVAARSAYYRHFLPAYRCHHHSNVPFMVGPDVVCGFALELDARRGPLDAEERETARRLGTYLEEALHAYERVRRMAAQALAGHGLLRAFAYPMWLIDVERYVSFENEAAQAERERGVRVACPAQRLQLVGDRADREFGLQLQRLAAAAHGTHAVVDLRRARADPPVWLHLATMVPGQALGAFGEQAQVVATLFDPRESPTLDAFVLGELFALTPAEARVAARLAEGATVQMLAAEQGVSVHTLRTHVSSLLRKFGVHRVTDIVRLLHQGDALWAAAGRQPR